MHNNKQKKTVTIPNASSSKLGRNIILTTPGGSGSTFVCKALNMLPNVVALNEPLPLRVYKEEQTKDLCNIINDYFSNMRESLKNTGTAVQGHGRNNFSTTNFDKQTEPFDLVIKQPLTFTALLGNPEIMPFNYEWFALIRNPLLTLCSWHNKGLQAGKEGRAETAELHDKDLKKILDDLQNQNQAKDILRLTLLGWAYKKYITFLDKNHIIEYENFVDDPLDELAKIVPNAKNSQVYIPVKNGNLNIKHRPNSEIFSIRLLKDNEPYTRNIRTFYNKNSVKDALKNLRQLPTNFSIFDSIT